MIFSPVSVCEDCGKNDPLFTLFIRPNKKSPIHFRDRFNPNVINLSIEILFYHEEHEVHEDISVLNFVFLI